MLKTNKIVLGALTLIPLVFLCLYLFNFSGIFDDGSIVQQQHDGPPAFMMQNFRSSVMLLGCFFISTLGLLVYYLFHLACHAGIKNDERFFWAVFFLFAGAIAFPLYWYFKVHLDVKTQS